MADVRQMISRGLIGLGVGLCGVTGTLALDRGLGFELPVETSNVQLLLGTFAGAIITLTVFALWMRTVVVGLRSGQISSRIITSYLDDRYQHRLLAAAIGATTFVSVVVLALPADSASAGPPAVSSVAAALITLFALGGVLYAVRAAIVSLSLPDIIRRLADTALDALEHPPGPNDAPSMSPPGPDRSRIAGERLGWVRDIDRGALVELLPPGATLTLCTEIGQFVADEELLALCDHPLDETQFDGVRRAITVGRTRFPDRDLDYAIQQLVDLAEHALRPASNDTSTAHEALVHLRAVLERLLRRGTVTGCLHGERGRTVASRELLAPRDHLEAAFDRLRVGGQLTPPSRRTVASTLATLRSTALNVGDHDSLAALDQQLHLLEDA